MADAKPSSMARAASLSLNPTPFTLDRSPYIVALEKHRGPVGIDRAAEVVNVWRR